MAPNRARENGTKAAVPDDLLIFDLDDLTIDELDMLEEATGMPFDEIIVEGKPKAKAMRAIAFVVKRRTDPDFTLEQAGQLRLKLSGQKPDPTKAAGTS